MAAITRTELKDKAKLEALIEARLNDMGVGELETEEHVPGIRAASKEYYLSLIQGHLANTEASVLDDVVHDYEGDVWGFIAGYKTCLRNHGGK